MTTEDEATTGSEVGTGVDEAVATDERQTEASPAVSNGNGQWEPSAEELPAVAMSTRTAEGANGTGNGTGTETAPTDSSGAESPPAEQTESPVEGEAEPAPATDAVDTEVRGADGPTRPEAPAPAGQTPSIAELVKRLSEQASRLAHQEIDLAKAELTEKGKRMTIGAGAFGAAALIALYAVGAIVAAAVILLARAVTPWLAAVIVGAVLALVAGAAALLGVRKVKQAGPPLPQQTAESVKQDVEMAKARAQAGRS